MFTDGFQLQLADLAWDEAAQEYVPLRGDREGAGVSGVGYQELTTSAHLALGQNFPNPVARATQIPLELNRRRGGVVPVVALWRLRGSERPRHVPPAARVGRGLRRVGRAAASYLYQVEVFNASGRFSDVKRMTLLK